MTLIEAVETVLDCAIFQDDGPFGEGWPSPKLEAARDFLYDWVDAQKQPGTTQPKEPSE